MSTYSFATDSLSGCLTITTAGKAPRNFPIGKFTLSVGRIYVKIHCPGEIPISIKASQIDGAETVEDVLEAIVTALGGTIPE